MCLKSIVKLNCKALLRFSASTTARTIPKFSLEASMFHKNGENKPYLVPTSLFSTNSKAPKKKEEDGRRISKHADLPLEKKKRPFTKEEDALILQKVEDMGYHNINTWKTLAIELNRDPTFYYNIRRRYNLIISRDTKEVKRFTEEDSNFIITYVEKNGGSKTTWKELAIKLGSLDARTIERHYLTLLKNFVKGKFTNAEDKIILDYVKVHGSNLQTFKNLCKKLNRTNPWSINRRFEHLKNKPSKKPGRWQIEEDIMLMEYFFQVNDRFDQFLNMTNLQTVFNTIIWVFIHSQCLFLGQPKQH